MKLYFSPKSGHSHRARLFLSLLGAEFDRTDWYPDDALGAARVQRWLSIAAGQLVQGPASARLVTLFAAKIDAQTSIDRSHALLGVIEAELNQTRWLAADHPTIADIAIYSYVARAPEGNVDLDEYPRVRAWLERIENLPGFVPFAVHCAGSSEVLAIAIMAAVAPTAFSLSLNTPDRWTSIAVETAPIKLPT